ncbi:hypothetical protein [uncultured Maribacter sp.]|uniref:hypothetical protein n=1 Tax=uncultured Maribacter sp. TaxID=431308 RepID=UPI00260265E9|nr:hypothetical protein [uncultured Maribacter sp.]
MKTTLLFIAMFTVLSLKSQESGQTYFFKTTMSKSGSQKLLTLDDQNSSKVDERINIKKRAKIQIDRIEGERVIFKYLQYKDSISAKLFNGEDGEKLFSMDTDVFEGLTNPLYNYFRGFAVSTYTVPIRLRHADDKFEFDGNASIGVNLVGRYGPSRYYEDLFIDFSIGLSISKVNLNEENSLLGTGDFENTKTLNPSAFTLTAGVLFGLAKGVNIGGYIGWDSISSADNRANWIYNKKAWFGIGIGIVAGSPDSHNANTTN